MQLQGSDPGVRCRLASFSHDTLFRVTTAIGLYYRVFRLIAVITKTAASGS